MRLNRSIEPSMWIETLIQTRYKRQILFPNTLTTISQTCFKVLN